MVRVLSWRIEGDYMYAHVALYSGQEYDAVYRISDEKFRLFGDARPGDRYDINKAIVRVFIDYKEGKIKHGQPQSLAWG